MVRKIYMLLLLTLLINADFNSSCVVCHSKEKIDLRKTFMWALLVYGGENNFKTALFYYCKNPISTSSVMSDEFLNEYIPLRKYIDIGDIELKKSINIYWEKYKIEGNLK